MICVKIWMTWKFLKLRRSYFTFEIKGLFVEVMPSANNVATGAEKSRIMRKMWLLVDSFCDSH